MIGQIGAASNTVGRFYLARCYGIGVPVVAGAFVVVMATRRTRKAARYTNEHYKEVLCSVPGAITPRRSRVRNYRGVREGYGRRRHNRVVRGNSYAKLSQQIYHTLWAEFKQ